MVAAPTQPVSAAQGIWRELCPRCRQGPIFRGPIVSYGLSIPPVLLLILLIWRFTGWDYDVSIVAAFVAYLPFVPAVARFARVVWMYIDQAFDPR